VEAVGREPAGRPEAYPAYQGVQLVAGEARIGGELHIDVALHLARLPP